MARKINDFNNSYRLAIQQPYSRHCEGSCLWQSNTKQSDCFAYRNNLAKSVARKIWQLFKSFQICCTSSQTVLTVLLLMATIQANCQTKYPINVETVLQKTKTNRPELEKALNYFYKGKDLLKIKAINFLIANMDIHTSYNYYWADSLGKRISFNELDFPDFDSSI